MSRTALPWKPIAWGLSAFAALGLVHGVIWLTAVDRMAVLLRRQADTLQERGWRVALGPARRMGWPGRAMLAVGPTSIASGALSWRAERVTADMALPWPGESDGPITMHPTNHWVRLGSGAERAISASGLTVEVAANNAVLQSTNVGVAGVFETQVLRLRLGPGSLEMQAERFRLFNAAGAPGPVIDAVALDVGLTPAVVPEDLPTAASAWQAAGGVMDVPRFTLTSVNARISGRAKLRLDAGLQPKLDGVMHVTGYAAGLDDLAKTGILAVPTVVAAKAVLGLLAAPSADGGADVPVQIADGVLTVAQFPLMRLPRLEWSVPASGP